MYQVRSEVLTQLHDSRRSVPLVRPRKARAAAIPAEAAARPEWYPNFPEVIFEIT